MQANNWKNGTFAGLAGIACIAWLAAANAAPPATVAATDSKPAAAESKKSSRVKVDEKIPAYTKGNAEVSGTIKSMGSDTMIELMQGWSQGFKKIYPNVRIEVEGKGSGTAPPALTQGTANFGPMSRDMKQEELDKFEGKFGYKPTQIKTSIDMLAVYVNKDNPIKGLTLAQVDAVFSKARARGAAKDVATWGDLGLTGEWKDKPISIYGRNAASGTYVYFKEHVLAKGDFKDSVKEQPGSSGVVQGVASDKYAIGYSGIGYITSDVRAVPLAAQGTTFVAAEAANAYSGDYPLARFLYVYVNYKPGSKLDALQGEFIKYVLSAEGQAEVIEAGYLPLTSKVAEKARKSVGL